LKTIVYIVQILALAAPGAALMELGYASPQFTAADQFGATAEMAASENAELTTTPSNAVADDWGMPLFMPGHGG
jgi:hypothetical protein